jgi:hypothetical protein
VIAFQLSIYTDLFIFDSCSQSSMWRYSVPNECVVQKPRSRFFLAASRAAVVSTMTPPPHRAPICVNVHQLHAYTHAQACMAMIGFYIYSCYSGSKTYVCRQAPVQASSVCVSQPVRLYDLQVMAIALGKDEVNLPFCHLDARVHLRSIRAKIAPTFNKGGVFNI